MAFRDFSSHEQGVGLLQRSLERGRLGHAYLFTGHDLAELERLARTLAKVLNCDLRRGEVAGTEPALPVDCCDTCLSCRKIEGGSHSDIHWVRPESKLRVVTVDQMRGLMHEVHLKPTEAEYKVGIVVAADRLNAQAANAFLKTLEEPPPRSVLILLTTDPQRLLETILSRCLRLNFGGDGARRLEPAQREWLEKFATTAAGNQKSLIGRYRLLDVIATRLGELKEEVEAALKDRSPLTKYAEHEIEAETLKHWEKELDAAVEAEYRLRRADLLALVQMWLRDVWLGTLSAGADLMHFPELTVSAAVVKRVSSRQALDNLLVLDRAQRLLTTNAQEPLVLEVSLLKLAL
jgi:DNA polymerase-3 subunit delta'